MREANSTSFEGANAEMTVSSVHIARQSLIIHVLPSAFPRTAGPTRDLLGYDLRRERP